MSNSKKSTLAIVSIAVIAVITGVIVQQSLTKSKPLPAFEKLIILPESKTIEYTNFTDQDGNSFDEEAFKGYWNILFFGFTACPDICPTTI